MNKKFIDPPLKMYLVENDSDPKTISANKIFHYNYWRTKKRKMKIEKLFK